MADELAKPQADDPEVALPEPPPKRQRIDLPPWLPLERIPRPLIYALAAVLIVGLILGTSIPFGLGWIDQSDLETLGYPGIFVANLLGTGTVFIPVPGLTLAGQGLIVAGAQTLWTPGVVIAGTLGLTLGETTAYLTGWVGRGAAEQRQMPVKGRFGVILRRVAGWIDWAMMRYGVITLLVLSAIPNPVFEFAGITAGAVRMNFLRFMLAVGIGNTIRVIILVIVGDAFLNLFDIG